MTTITETLRNAIVDCTVTDTTTGEEMTDVSGCYVALVQSLQDTLPSHVTVEWGPSATRHRQAVDQAPAWVWEAALEGRLVLDGGRVAQRIVGRAAIQRAEAEGITLSTYTDPTAEGRDGVSVEEARDIAREDPSLVYMVVSGAA